MHATTVAVVGKPSSTGWIGDSVVFIWCSRDATPFVLLGEDALNVIGSESQASTNRQMILLILQCPVIDEQGIRSCECNLQMGKQLLSFSLQLSLPFALAVAVAGSA